MANRRGDPRPTHRLGTDDGRPDTARSRLTGAVSELRRLTQDQLIQTVERLLTDFGQAATGSSIGVEDARRLKLRRAEYLHVAAELEAAAYCCRVIERELGPWIDALLADSEGQLATTGQYHAGVPTVDIHRSLNGWLREIFRWGRTSRAQAIDGPLHALPELRPLPLMLSAARSHLPPAPAVPQADVAALVLGPLQLRVAGQWVLRWNSLKARAVFQYLLIHQGRPVRRDVLMELHWPDHSHDSARNNLNVALYSLRNTLDGPRRGVQPILYRDGCYALNPKLTWWIDRNEFLSMLNHAQSARRAGRPQQAIDAY